MRRWGLPRGVACLGVTEASGSGVVRWLAAGSFTGRRGACVGAVRRAVAMPMRCLGRFVPSWRARWACGDPGASYGVVSGGGLGGVLRQHADRLNGRLAHAAALCLRTRGGADCRRSGMEVSTNCTHYAYCCAALRSHSVTLELEISFSICQARRQSSQRRRSPQVWRRRSSSCLRPSAMRLPGSLQRHLG